MCENVAHIMLDRPEAGNGINLQLAKELMEVATRCDEDAAVRAVVIGSTGKAFCVGGDLGYFSAAAEGMPTALKEVTTHLHAAISRLVRMRPPVVAAVGGAAAGAGFSLVCAADFAFAGESVRFSMAYTRVGLTPDGSSTYLLPRLIGRRRALELMITNRTLSAAEALDWGLVNRVVPDADLAGEVETFALELAAGPTIAFGMTKRLVLDGALDSLESQMEQETRTIADASRTSDAREGIKAFFEKRHAEFTGS